MNQKWDKTEEWGKWYPEMWLFLVGEEKEKSDRELYGVGFGVICTWHAHETM